MERNSRSDNRAEWRASKPRFQTPDCSPKRLFLATMSAVAVITIDGNRWPVCGVSFSVLLRSRFVKQMLLIATLISFAAFNAAACSCGPVPSVADSFRQSDAVFLAIITSLRKVDKDPYGMPRFRLSFNVSKVWKGHITTKFEMIGDA